MNEAPEAYEAKAHEYLSTRERSNIGCDEVVKWSSNLRRNATIVDLACGGGLPITSALKKLGFSIWAVDSSPTLVEVFKSRLPDVPIQCKNIQEFDFFNQKYDAAIAIGLIFLLSEADQINLITDVSKILNPGGRFLFSAPQQAATWDDVCTGNLSISLGKSSYEELLTNAGFQVGPGFTDTGDNYYFDAELGR